jgi:hypothetical protein
VLKEQVALLSSLLLMLAPVRVVLSPCPLVRCLLVTLVAWCLKLVGPRLAALALFQLLSVQAAVARLAMSPLLPAVLLAKALVAGRSICLAGRVLSRVAALLSVVVLALLVPAVLYASLPASPVVVLVARPLLVLVILPARPVRAATSWSRAGSRLLRPVVPCRWSPVAVLLPRVVTSTLRLRTAMAPVVL